VSWFKRVEQISARRFAKAALLVEGAKMNFSPICVRVTSASKCFALFAPSRMAPGVCPSNRIINFVNLPTLARMHAKYRD